MSATKNSIQTGQPHSSPLKVAAAKADQPCVSIVCTFLLGALVFTATILGQPQPGQGEFVPVSALPPTEQLPAAPLLIGAYAVVWIIAMAYIWSIWRRLGKVEHDMRELERRQSQRAR